MGSFVEILRRAFPWNKLRWGFGILRCVGRPGGKKRLCFEFLKVFSEFVGNFTEVRIIPIKNKTVWYDELDISIKLGNSRIFIFRQVFAHCPQIHWLFHDVNVVGDTHPHVIYWFQERPPIFVFSQTSQNSFTSFHHLRVRQALDRLLPSGWWDLLMEAIHFLKFSIFQIGRCALFVISPWFDGSIHNQGIFFWQQLGNGICLTDCQFNIVHNITVTNIR